MSTRGPPTPWRERRGRRGPPPGTASVGRTGAGSPGFPGRRALSRGPAPARTWPSPLLPPPRVPASPPRRWPQPRSCHPTSPNPAWSSSERRRPAPRRSGRAPPRRGSGRPARASAPRHGDLRSPRPRLRRGATWPGRRRRPRTPGRARGGVGPRRGRRPGGPGQRPAPGWCGACRQRRVSRSPWGAASIASRRWRAMTHGEVVARVRQRGEVLGGREVPGLAVAAGLAWRRRPGGPPTGRTGTGRARR